MSTKSFEKLMTMTATVRKMGRDSSGNFETEAETVAVPCFFEHAARTFIDLKGETHRAAGTLFFKDDAPLDITHGEWQFIVDGGTYVAAGLDKIHDPRSAALHHWEVLVL